MCYELWVRQSLQRLAINSNTCHGANQIGGILPFTAYLSRTGVHGTPCMYLIKSFRILLWIPPNTMSHIKWMNLNWPLFWKLNTSAGRVISPQYSCMYLIMSFSMFSASNLFSSFPHTKVNPQLQGKRKWQSESWEVFYPWIFKIYRNSA